MLPDIINEYNNSYHSGSYNPEWYIMVFYGCHKMSPVELSKKKNEGIVYYNLYSNLKETFTKPKFKVEDTVKISKYKRKTFDKG